MKLKSYIKKLQKLAEQYPDAVLLYSIDEEGNGFNEVVYDPSENFWWDGNDIYYEKPKGIKVKRAIVLN